jgi:uncharacterized repeat protein (TIGR01451 family)
MNAGTEHATDTELSLTFTNGVRVVSSTQPFTQVNATTWKFSLGTLAPGATASFEVTDSVSLALSVGTPVTITMNVTAAGNDDNTSNNTYLIQQPVTGPIDPNDLIVSPAGDGTEGYVAPDVTLHYRVRFQNVGSAAAEKVIITDMLPPAVNPASVAMIASSHSYEFTLSPEGLCTWTFDGINLPDSATNNEGSNGFVEFTVTLRAGLPSGTVVSNTANIQFDFEEPIRTNTVINTIKYVRTGEEAMLQAWPNPTADRITITSQSASLMYSNPVQFNRCIVYAADGRIVYDAAFDATSHVTIETGTWTAGLYVAILQTTDGERQFARFVHATE